MLYKFLWVAPDHLDVWSGYSRRQHLNAVQDMAAQGIIGSEMPENYLGGEYSQDTFNPENPAFDRFKITWEGGQYPSEDEMKYLLRQHLDVDRESRYLARVLQDRMAATVEDSEPAYNNGFMKEPHKELYPCAWGDDENMRPEAKKTLLNHVLNSLEEAGYPQADSWIAFSVYGSGASYNWDEDGDFDVQMWLNTESYNTDADPVKDPDDLLADVRRAVQKVNFPSFKELGLDTPDCEGRMLIQFYPKLGKGTADENLASKPYACYSIDDDEWFQHPEPIEPTFYGEQFLLVMPKAQDIAIQAEALLGELERNSVNWQFWSAMFDKWGDSRYDEQAEDAKNKATEENEGVKILFQGVFGGRQQAYSPDGKGIKDERDIIQKLLEVWGIFQRLKHFARQPLPWTEQKMPDEKKDDESDDEKNSAINTLTSKLVISAPVISHKLTIADSDLSVKVANWDEIMEKAKRLKNNGQVFITNNGTQHVEGQVVGDTGTYDTQFDRMDPNSQAITTWNCSCPWGEVSWGRTRQWKKYEGRPCAHTLAMFWASKSQPVAEQGQQQLFQQTPQNTLPSPAPGGPNLPQPAPPAPAPVGVQPIPAVNPAVAPPPPPVTSQPTKPGDPKLGPLGIPGALSKLKVSDLVGLPEKALGPHRELENVAKSYMEQSGLPYRQPKTYQRVDPQRARMIAQAYDRMEHNPNDPKVKASYNALINETKAQYDHLKQNGYKFEFYPGQGSTDPYPTGPRAAIEDLRNNKHMYVYPTYAAFGQGDDDGLGDQDHPLLQHSGEYWGDEPVTHNDIFRAVHDAFGHAKEGVGFRADGEENAWRQHSSMYSDLARPAMTSETRGQNSWVNFGPHGETNQNANQAETVYAEQKAGLLPSWAEKDVIHEQKAAAFANGEKVKARLPMWGIDRDGNAQMVPTGSSGEVLFSDERDTIAIFPLDTGVLEPHLVRVQSETENFIKGKGKTPFVGVR